MPSVQCPHCAAKLNVKEAALGKQGRCPKCQQKFLLQLPKLEDEYALAPLDEPAVGISPPAALMPSKPTTTAAEGRQSADQPPQAKTIPVWAIPAAAGGGLLVLLMLSLVFWVGIGLLRGGGNALPGGNAQSGIDDSGRIVAPARQAKAGRTSSVPSVEIESAPPATWNVTADGVPLSEGLRSFIPLEGVRRGSLAFARPDVAEVAIVDIVRFADAKGAYHYGYDWVRLDLRNEKPPQRIHLWQADTPREELLLANEGAPPQSRSLSPSGERLAIVSGGSVWVWTKDGARLTRISVERSLGTIPWIAFAGDDGMWVQASDKLLRYSIPDGEPTVELAETLHASPTLTPGGKFVLAVTDQGLVVLSAADGSPAGVLSLPQGFHAKAPPAINPAGTRVALALADREDNALFLVWDLDTGKLDRAIEQTYFRVQRRLAGLRLVWLGDEVLLTYHTYFHLGLGEVLGHERRVEELPAGPSPDGRLWQMRPIVDPEQAAQIGEQPAEFGSAATLYVTAATMPPPAMQDVIQQTGGFAWHPGIAVRGELLGVPPKYRDAVAEGFSDWLASQGFTVDPQAPIKIELTVSREPDSETTGKAIPPDQLTPAMKKKSHMNPHFEWVELLKVKNLKVEGTVYDAAGKPAFVVPALVFGRPIDKGGDDDPVWQALAKWQSSPPLPETFFRDSDGKRVFLTSAYIVPGADGVIDTVIDPPKSHLNSRDPFELPEE